MEVPILKQHDYRGMLFLDDIHLNTAMIRFWDGISELKEDLTDLGHLSGSGLVAMGSTAGASSGTPDSERAHRR